MTVAGYLKIREDAYMPDINQINIDAKERLVKGLRGKGAHMTIDQAVEGFPTSLYNVKPDHVPYTFWHQLEHIRITQWDILKYVVDPGHVSPSWPEGYWPDQSAEADEKAWNQTIEQYKSDLEELIALVESGDVNVLEPVPHNNGRSIMFSMLIVIDHASYHLGEFVMGRQILGAWKSALA